MYLQIESAFDISFRRFKQRSEHYQKRIVTHLKKNNTICYILVTLFYSSYVYLLIIVTKKIICEEMKINKIFVSNIGCFFVKWNEINGLLGHLCTCRLNWARAVYVCAWNKQFIGYIHVSLSLRRWNSFVKTRGTKVFFQFEIIINVLLFPIDLNRPGLLMLWV